MDAMEFDIWYVTALQIESRKNKLEVLVIVHKAVLSEFCSVIQMLVKFRQ